jgi:hypothetical protein
VFHFSILEEDKMMDSFLSLFFGKDNSRHHHQQNIHHQENDKGCVVVGVCGNVGNGAVIGMDDIDMMNCQGTTVVGSGVGTINATAAAAANGGSSMAKSSATSGSSEAAVVVQMEVEASSTSSSSRPKRARRTTATGRNSTNSTASSAPVLVSLPSDSDDRPPPSKRLRGVHGERVAVYHCSDDNNINNNNSDDDDEATAASCPLLASDASISTVVEEEKALPSPPPPQSPLSLLPEDVLAHCLSFLGGVQDRHALQCTNKQFRRISNTDEMLLGIQVGGDKQTGLHGIISEKDTPVTASAALEPFASAGNLEAIYM